MSGSLILKQSLRHDLYRGLSDEVEKGTLIDMTDINADKDLTYSKIKWISDYPFLAHVKSDYELVIIDLSSAEKPQRVVSLFPYKIDCLMDTQVSMNQAFFARKFEEESHILVLVRNDENRLFMVDLRLDAFDANLNTPAGRIAKKIKCPKTYPFSDATFDEDVKCDVTGETIPAGEQFLQQVDEDGNSLFKLRKGSQLPQDVARRAETIRSLFDADTAKDEIDQSNVMLHDSRYSVLSQTNQLLVCNPEQRENTEEV